MKEGPEKEEYMCVQQEGHRAIAFRLWGMRGVAAACC